MSTGINKLPIMLRPEFYYEEEVYIMCNNDIKKGVVSCFQVHFAGMPESTDIEAIEEYQKVGHVPFQDLYNSFIDYHVTIHEPTGQVYAVTVPEGKISRSVEGLLKRLSQSYTKNKNRHGK